MKNNKFSGSGFCVPLFNLGEDENEQQKPKIVGSRQKLPGVVLLETATRYTSKKKAALAGVSWLVHYMHHVRNLSWSGVLINEWLFNRTSGELHQKSLKLAKLLGSPHIFGLCHIKWCTHISMYATTHGVESASFMKIRRIWIRIIYLASPFPSSRVD